MPAEPDPAPEGLDASPSAASTLQNASPCRITQWATSWAKCFRNDSTIKPGVTETTDTLVPDPQPDESADLNSKPPPSLAQ